MTGEIHHVDAGYNVIGMKAEDAPDIALSDGHPRRPRQRCRRDPGGASRRFPGPAEADLVERLIGDGDAVVSLVAEERDRIVGHVLLSRKTVSGDGRDYRALGLGPIGVNPERQNKGVGSALVWAAIGRARELERN